MDELLDEATRALLLRLAPYARTAKDPIRAALQGLLDSERWRKGEPDPTGAQHLFSLTQGSLLNPEFDLSTHAHASGWQVDTLAVDVKAMILLNQRYGFAVGDEVLRAVATAMRAAHPNAKLVRTGPDAFTLIFPPSSEEHVTEAMRDALLPKLVAAVEAVLPDDGDPKPAIGFNTALLSLTVVDPSHPQLLGPLVWAENERAQVLAKRGATGVQPRRVDLAGRVETGT